MFQDCNIQKKIPILEVRKKSLQILCCCLQLKSFSAVTNWDFHLVSSTLVHFKSSHNLDKQISHTNSLNKLVGRDWNSAADLLEVRVVVCLVYHIKLFQLTNFDATAVKTGYVYNLGENLLRCSLQTKPSQPNIGQRCLLLNVSDIIHTDWIEKITELWKAHEFDACSYTCMPHWTCLYCMKIPASQLVVQVQAFCKMLGSWEWALTKTDTGLYKGNFLFILIKVSPVYLESASNQNLTAFSLNMCTAISNHFYSALLPMQSILP